MWGIDSVPEYAVERMKMPLFTVDNVAEMMGVTSHTIRRAGNQRDPNWNLPEHYDLGCRLRRYLPIHIEAWMKCEPLDDWLKRRCGPRAAVGMVPIGRLRHLGEPK